MRFLLGQIHWHELHRQGRSLHRKSIMAAIAFLGVAVLLPAVRAEARTPEAGSSGANSSETVTDSASPGSETTNTGGTTNSGTTQTPTTQGTADSTPDLPPPPNIPIFGAPVQEIPGAPVNPLELKKPDPLLPRLLINRPLSPQERDVLNTALNRLDRQAKAKYQTGDIPGALEIWNRELRLRRFLGVQAEVASLSQVGEVAWKESQVTEVRVIAQRLQQIQQEVQARPRPDYDLLLSIAQAYQKVRAQSQAISLYTQLLTEARQRKDIAREQQILTAQADLYLAWFDYPNAAATYEQLLMMARARKDSKSEVLYLQQLAYVYEQDSQFPQAIDARQQLVNFYQKQKNFVPIPQLKLAIGDDYAVLGRLDLAASSYQESFATARSTQEYGYATDALQRLADLYRALKRPDDTLVVYQLLLDVQQQSYNALGMMNTYDLIGQIYRTEGKKDQAIAAFRHALQIAQQLKYKVAYFGSQIEKTINPPPPSPPPTTQPPASPSPTEQPASPPSSGQPSANPPPASQLPANPPFNGEPSNSQPSNSQPSNSQPSNNPLFDTNPPFNSEPPNGRSLSNPLPPGLSLPQ